MTKQFVRASILDKQMLVLGVEGREVFRIESAGPSVMGDAWASALLELVGLPEAEAIFARRGLRVVRVA